MKTKCLLFAVALLALASSGCTKNIRAKQWGGTTTETLAPGRKLVMVTWKYNDLWMLTRPARSNETAETYSLKESSAWGVFQGEVIVIEAPTR